MELGGGHLPSDHEILGSVSSNIERKVQLNTVQIQASSTPSMDKNKQRFSLIVSKANQQFLLQNYTVSSELNSLLPLSDPELLTSIQQCYSYAMCTLSSVPITKSQQQNGTENMPEWRYSSVCSLHWSSTARCCAGPGNSVNMPVSGWELPQSTYFISRTGDQSVLDARNQWKSF